MTKRNIVVLDGYAANPGDLSWDELRSIGDCQIFDRTSPSRIAERCQEAAVIVTNKVPIVAEMLDGLKSLKSIAVMATGYDIVDADAARDRRIYVQNVPAYSTESVAQLVFAHLLNLTNRTSGHAQLVREGRWTASQDWCFCEYPQIELSGLTLGIVGFGRIGRAVARIASAFGMNVLVTTRTPTAPDEMPAAYSVRFVELRQLLEQSDAVTLHCPLTKQTQHLINSETLGLMRSSSFLINTSRGGLVDSSALAGALAKQRIRGAGIDVLEQEPPPVEHPLTNLDQCFVTPHVAWATRAARQRLMAAVVSNVKSLLAGEPANVVNPW